MELYKSANMFTLNKVRINLNKRPFILTISMLFRLNFELVMWINLIAVFLIFDDLLIEIQSSFFESYETVFCSYYCVGFGEAN